MYKKVLFTPLGLLLACFSCMPATAYSASNNQKAVQQITEVKPLSSLQLPGANLTTKKWQQNNFSNKQTNYNLSWENSQLLLAKQGNYMTLTPTGRKNALGNPFYKLRLYAKGQLIAAYETVSGRGYTQNRNRNLSGTEAPLPDGLYAVAKSTIPSANPEVGGAFLPIKPSFATGRTELGIHYDPSFEKNNNEDGTSGCIALKNKSELYRVLDYVRTYRPKYLEVNIQ